MKLKKSVELYCVEGEYLGIVAKNGAPKAMLRSNGTGYFLLNSMTAEVTAEALKDKLIEKYDVAEEVAAADIGRFVEELASRGLLDE